MKATSSTGYSTSGATEQARKEGVMKTTSSTDPHRWVSRVQSLVAVVLFLLFLFLILIIFVPHAQAATCNRTLTTKVVVFNMPMPLMSVDGEHERSVPGRRDLL